jgi:hypothetical protein
MPKALTAIAFAALMILFLAGVAFVVAGVRLLRDVEARAISDPQLDEIISAAERRGFAAGYHQGALHVGAERCKR